MQLSRLLSSMLVVATATGATIIACGGSSTPKKPDGKIVVIDSPGSGSGSCAAAASYSPSFGSNQFAVNYPASGSGSSALPHFEHYQGLLAQGTLLDIQLFQGYGGFGSGDIRNGTYTISGADAAYSTCGICPTIWANVTTSGSGSSATLNVGAYYTAASGTLTLTSTSGSITGSISNMSFQHVATMTDSMGNKFPADPPAADSCTSMISSANFTATLMAGSANFTYEGATEDGTPVRIHLAARPE